MKKLPFIAFLLLIIIPLALPKLITAIDDMNNSNRFREGNYVTIKRNTIGYSDIKYKNRINEIMESELPTENKVKIAVEYGADVLSDGTFKDEAKIIKSNLLKNDVQIELRNGKRLWIKKSDIE